MRTYKVYCNIEGSTFLTTVTGVLHVSEAGYYLLVDEKGTERYYPINRTVIEQVTQ